MNKINTVSRRRFIQSVTAMLPVVLMPSCASFINDNKKIKIGICSDIHHDLMPDAKSRLQSFIDEAKESNVDFIIQLGDFCLPKSGNIPFLNIWNQFKGPKYHVLGNHDMDKGSKKEVIEFLGMENAYYSFDMGTVHFVVLDPNGYMKNGKYEDIDHGNYLKSPGRDRYYISKEQLMWLEQDLKMTQKPTILFSHQSFQNPKACKNGEKVRDILEKTNKEAGFNKVIASFSGHDHTDDYVQINGIKYIQINSMSEMWLGRKYKCDTRYTSNIYKNHSALKYVAPYKDPLYAIMEIDPKQYINIKGKTSTFIAPGPKQLGYDDTINGRTKAVAKISNRKIAL